EVLVPALPRAGASPSRGATPSLTMPVRGGRVVRRAARWVPQMVSCGGSCTRGRRSLRGPAIPLGRGAPAALVFPTWRGSYGPESNTSRGDSLACGDPHVPGAGRRAGRWYVAFPE